MNPSISSAATSSNAAVPTIVRDKVSTTVAQLASMPSKCYRLLTSTGNLSKPLPVKLLYTTTKREPIPSVSSAASDLRDKPILNIPVIQKPQTVEPKDTTAEQSVESVAPVADAVPDKSEDGTNSSALDDTQSMTSVDFSDTEGSDFVPEGLEEDSRDSQSTEPAGTRSSEAASAVPEVVKTPPAGLSQGRSQRTLHCKVCRTPCRDAQELWAHNNAHHM